jgi:hypothetical protein
MSRSLRSSVGRAIKSQDRLMPISQSKVEKLKKTALIYQKTTKPNKGKKTSGADDILNYLQKLR